MTTNSSTTEKIARGLRLNNPGNIRRSCARWLGLSKVQTDKDFAQFDEMYYGLRALYKLLLTYYTKHRCHTIRQIISRYAPATENQTEKYIRFVVNRLEHFTADDDLNLPISTYTHYKLMRAICWMETNYVLNWSEFYLMIVRVY